MVRPDNSAKRDQARIIAATGQADIDAQQRALAEGGQESLNREIVAQQLAANRVNLERRKEAGQISQTQYDQQLKQQQDMVERNSQFYGEALKSSVDAGVSRHRASDRASGQIGESHRFYREIGYSQFAGRYAPFEIPEGHEVRGITEGPEGLNITFVDPVAEKQAKEQYAASEMFYKSIGFEQYGGKYSPFDIPEGHKVRGITEGPTGLNIEFYDPVAEQQAKNAAMVSDMFYKSIGFGEFGGKYSPFDIPEGHTVHSITESEAGLNITFLGPSAPASQVAAPTSSVAAPELSNIEKVIVGDLSFDALTESEKNELYMLTSSQSMAPLMAFRNFAIQQKQDSKAEFTDVLKEGKTATAGASAGGIMKSIALAEKSVAKAAAATTSGLINPLGSDPAKTMFLGSFTRTDIPKSGALTITNPLGADPATAGFLAAEAGGYIRSDVLKAELEAAAQPKSLAVKMLDYSKSVTESLKQNTGNNPLTNALANNLREGLDIGAGLVAAVEGLTYGTVALFGSAKKSIETGQLQYSPGFEAFGIKAPRLAPTMSGSIVSSVLGNTQELKNFGDQSLSYRVSAGLGELGLMAAESMATGAALGKISRVIRGAKATELKSATEFSRAVTEGQKTTIKRFTQFETKTVRLKGADLDYYSRYNLQTLQKARLDMAGTQNIKTVKLDVAGFPEEITVYGKAAESTRSANPVLAALKGERLAYGKVGQYARGISKTTIKAQTPTKTARLTNAKPSTTLQKNIVLDKSFTALREPVKLSARKFTTIKASGLADDLEYLAAAKAVPDDLAQQIYKRLGGSYRPLVEKLSPKTTSGAMKPGSNKFFREGLKKIEASPTRTGSKAVTVLEARSKTIGKTVNLERAILSVETKTKTVAAPLTHVPTVTAQKETLQLKTKTDLAGNKQSYPHRTSITQRPRYTQEEEQIYYTQPGQLHRLDETPVVKPVIMPVTELKATPQQIDVFAGVISTPKQTVIQTPKVISPTKKTTKTVPTLTPKTTPVLTPIFTPVTTQKTTSYTTPHFGQTPKLSITQIPKTTTTPFPAPKPTKPLTIPSPFTPPYSQQKGRKRTRGMFGVWRKQDNPVKTSAAMLKTFGILQGKPKRSAKVKRRKR